MAVVEVYLKASTAIAAATFAALVLASGPRRVANVYLAGFLALIFANQAVEAYTLVGSAPDSVEHVRLHRIASVFAALDPLLLFYVASVFPERNRLNRALPLALVVGASGVLALLGTASLPVGPMRVGDAARWWAAGDAARLAFTAIVYGIVFAQVCRGAARGARGAAPLAAAMALAFVPVLANASYAGIIARLPEATQAARFTVGLAGAMAAVALAGLLVARAVRAAPRRGTVLVGFAVGAALAVVPFLPGALVHYAGSSSVPAPFVLLGRAQAAARWLGFSALASIALLRADGLGMTLRARWRAARVVLGLALALAAGALVVVADAIGVRPAFSFAPVTVAALLLVVLASGRLHALVERLATTLYALPPRAGGAPAPSRAVTALAPGALVAGRYHILGAMNRDRSWLAEDGLLERAVVLVPVATGHALDEARAVAGLADARVLALHDFIRTEDGAIVVQEHLLEGTLAQRLAEGRRLSPEESGRLVADVVAGLAAGATRGLVARAVDPTRVHLFERGAKVDLLGRGAGPLDDVAAIAGLARSATEGALPREYEAALASSRSLAELATAWAAARATAGEPTRT